MSLPSMSNDNMNDSLPWYFKFIYTFGVPAVLTLYLVYFMVSRIDNQLTMISATLAIHQSDMINNLKTNDELKQQLFSTNLILQRICVNTATDQNARNNCFGPIQ